MAGALWVGNMAGIDKALSIIRTLPRVALNNIRNLPGADKKKKKRLGKHRGMKCGRGDAGQNHKGNLPYLGHAGGASPFYLKIPKEPYYKGHHLRREYPPLSMLELQRMIDLGLIDPEEPIDLSVICNTKRKTLRPLERHYGFNLTDEGADIFDAKINIEVQWTNEVTIAAIEKNGGTITSRFFDMVALQAMIDPVAWFKKGRPIPRCKLPPQDAVAHYSDAKNRGYLANPDEIREERITLAQKYGYILPDISRDPMFDKLMMRKDPRQIFYGLAPGWVVNLKDRKILKPKDPEFIKYYNS